MRQKPGPEVSNEERMHSRMQLVYARRTRERRIFFNDLKDYRRQRDKGFFKEINDNVGPAWYHALSVPQRCALDTLERSIYQDLLEDRPTRTSKIIRILGIYPRPTFTNLMTCNYLGRNDPKEMLAQLFVVFYGHAIDGKRATYCLNGKVLLSSILYLGLDNIIHMLRERFRPEPQKAPPKIKPKPKEPPSSSPYLQQQVAVLYYPTKPAPTRPPALPNLEELNELATAVEEDELVIPKPPPPPPPPPAPKNRLPRSYCDKLAGVVSIGPQYSLTDLAKRTAAQTGIKRIRAMSLEVKKTYGVSGSSSRKVRRKRRPVAPSTGMWNAQYTINGVYTIHNKTVFVLGNVSILPPNGDLIHGGYKYIEGEYVNIHCGFRARPPPPKPDPCDCVKQWHEAIFKYVKTTKCYCGHHYDYGNEGTFLPDEVPFFEKPTGKAPFSFNYTTIYNMDPKKQLIDKEFKKVWDTDSVLHVDVEDGTVKKEKKKKKEKLVKKTSTTCLGQNPKAEDYLRCALRLMRRDNLAARLPDVHLAPELREWMRRRIHGPITPQQKEALRKKSTTFWQFFHSLSNRGFGHRTPANEAQYSGVTTWRRKQQLNDKFRKFSDNYRLKLFRSFAYVNNLMWATMYQAEFPNKKFREIYFSYMFTRCEELTLQHPYSTREANERYNILLKKRYICLPAGIEKE